LTQLVAPWVSSAIGGDFLKSGATNQALITPAGYAFSLWGLITLLSAATGRASWWTRRSSSSASRCGWSSPGRTGCG
jgi:hypothetical protein